MAENGKFRLNRRDFLRIAGIGAGAAAVTTVSKPAAAASHKAAILLALRSLIQQGVPIAPGGSRPLMNQPLKWIGTSWSAITSAPVRFVAPVWLVMLAMMKLIA